MSVGFLNCPVYTKGGFRHIPPMELQSSLMRLEDVVKYLNEPSAQDKLFRLIIYVCRLVEWGLKKRDAKSSLAVKLKRLDGIIQHLPTPRQTLLFSATQTKSVKQLARLSMKVTHTCISAYSVQQQHILMIICRIPNTFPCTSKQSPPHQRS